MARREHSFPENAPGEFFVDTTCIDCATCRQLAPATFAERPAGQSFVRRQPENGEEARRAAMALVSCPTASIGNTSKRAVQEAIAAFPEQIEDEVYYCGFASESSFGASSYLIVRREGNVLVDSPRAAKPLLDRIEALGGVRYLFLTHRDDVADHEKLASRFGCERILHERDVTRGTAGVERKLGGAEPIALAPDLRVVPVPGHTPGSAALLYRNRFLFTGDHLWGTPRGDALHASRSVCWYSWPEQLRSLERLLAESFTRVLPGHGHRYFAGSPEAMRTALGLLLDRVRARP